MRGRETGEETRTFVNALSRRCQHNTARVLISVRESRPVFKVEEWGFSDAISKVLGTRLRVAFIADSKEVATSQEWHRPPRPAGRVPFPHLRRRSPTLQWLRAAA